MKIKNLNFVEKHIEKVIVAVGVLYCALVMWFYVMGEPYQVEVPGSKTLVTPTSVEAEIKKKADRLDEQVSRTELPFDKVTLPKYTNEFKSRMDQRFLPFDRYTVPMGNPGLEDQELGGDLPVVFVPQPPPTFDVRTRAGYAVLGNDMDPRLQQAYISLIGDQTPRDFKYVTVSARFDVKKYRARLTDPIIPENRRMPEDWWQRELTVITDVRLQRQEQDPITGVWGPAIDDIAPMPTQEPNYRHPPINFTPADAKTVFDDIKENADRIRTPPFVSVAVGSWTSPDAPNGPTAAPVAPKPPSGPAARPAAPPANAPLPPGAKPNAAPDFITVWAHDLTVKAGRTYRYRIMVDLIDPLFQRTDQLPRQQVNLYFNKLSLTSEAGEWSQPVVIDPEFYYFFVGGNVTNGTANVEIYKVFDGIWARPEFQIRPGDMIGRKVKLASRDGKEQWVDLTAGVALVDLENVASTTGPAASTTQRVIVYDSNSNQLITTTVDADLDNERRKQLHKEVEERRGTAAPTAPRASVDKK